MSIRIPTRAELLSQYERAELYGKCWAGFDIVMIGLSLWFIDFNRVLTEPFEAFAICGMGIGPTIMSLAYLFAQKQKNVQDLREDVKFGSITKPMLLSAIQGVLTRMNIPQGDIKFIVTAGKQVNAGALALGLGRLVPKLRAVYLNRATLHALSAAELSTVIAHELAHIYRYPLQYQRGLFLHMIASALLALLAWSYGFYFIISLAIIGGYYYAVNFIFGRYSQVVEFLCDDCGAEIGGIDSALRAEFLISQHSEIVSQATRVALERKLAGQNISAKDIQSLIDDSLTFDPPKAEDLEKEVLGRLNSREVRSSNSFFHFAKDIVFSDGPDATSDLEERLAEMRKAVTFPTVELPPGSQLSREWFAELVKRMEAEPRKLLFRVPEEISDMDSTHPGPRRRILYIWKNFVSADSKESTIS